MFLLVFFLLYGGLQAYAKYMKGVLQSRFLWFGIDTRKVRLANVWGGDR